jgi:hypothetical protein
MQGEFQVYVYSHRQGTTLIVFTRRSFVQYADEYLNLSP